MTRQVLQNWKFVGAVLGGVAVAAGAFGAHALRDRLDGPSLGRWHTGAQYEMAHALALVLVGIVSERAPSRALTLAGWAFTTGVVLFSGSLYALAISPAPWLGPVTPLGGLLLLAGWVALAVSAIPRK